MNTATWLLRLSGYRTLAWGSTAALCAVMGISAGCYWEGGPGYSDDQFTYVSRAWQPWTITLKDTRTGQDFWSIDVPQDQQLVVHFIKGDGTPGGFTPDRMEWGLMEAGTLYQNLENSIPVPPADARRLDPTLRPVPELPPGMIGSTSPKVAPVISPADATNR